MHMIRMVDETDRTKTDHLVVYGEMEDAINIMRFMPNVIQIK